MKDTPNRFVLGAIIVLCVFVQIFALTTKYEGVYDFTGGCWKNLENDCGPSSYEIQTLFGAYPIDPGSFSGYDLNRYRVIALIAPLVLEVAAVATLLRYRNKQM